MAFRISIDAEQKETLLKAIEEGLAVAQGDRKDFDRRRLAIYNAYRNRPKKKDTPFPGCANFSTPIITRSIERMTVQTMQTVAPRGFFSKLVATPNQVVDDVDDVQERSDAVSQYLSVTFRHRMRLHEKIEPFVRGGLLYGNAYAKLWHNREIRKVRRVDRYPAIALVPVIPEAADTENEPEIREQVVPPEVTLMTIYGHRGVKITEVDPKSGPEGTKAWMVKYYDTSERRRREIHVEIYYDEEYGENVVLSVADEVVRDDPDFQNISLDDIYFTTEGETLQDSSLVLIRQRLTISDVTARYRRGVFNQITADDLEDMNAYVGKDEETKEVPSDKLTHEMTTRMVQTTVRTRADQVEGVRSGPYQRLDIWEVFMTYDLDRDDEDEEIVVWVDFATRKILRVAHLDEDYFSNSRPIVEWGLIPVENRTLKMGIGELLMPLQTQFDQLFNNRQDAASVSLMPGGFYKPGSGFYPNKMRWAPGAWIPVDNPQADIQLYTPTNNPRDTINVEQFLLALVEDLSISTYAFGRGPDRPNAPRTARGTIAILQQDSIKMDFILKRLLPAIEDVCHRVLHLLRLHSSASQQFRVLGTDKIMTINPEDLERRYTFTIDVDAVSANREIQRIYAAQALQMIGPLAQAPPEQVSPGMRTLGRNLLNRLEFRNAHEILRDPAGYKRGPANQEYETAAMFSGITIEPIAEDDHVAHMVSMDATEQTEQFNSMPLEWVKNVWAPHKRMHLEMYRQQGQAMQAQMQGIGGQGGGGTGPVGGIPRMGNLPMGQGGGVEAAPEAAGSTLTGTDAGSIAG